MAEPLSLGVLFKPSVNLPCGLSVTEISNAVYAPKKVFCLFLVFLFGWFLRMVKDSAL